MEFKLSIVSNWCFSEMVTINSLEDLKNLQKKYKNFELIVDFVEMQIVVYDDYRE